MVLSLYSITGIVKKFPWQPEDPLQHHYPVYEYDTDVNGPSGLTILECEIL